ncbi:hypothetical protein Y032_0319g2364 [Ancylostoma ceylanicum]|uniref:Uncharacterized protein n=1 Tax=Ancylostoma ceylanicum TaxID=53326 RepID=A0A016S0X6_9BILA|nr:hypothetical protein Y032_0319g2364 [Ancylostoma ceylanicum]
MTIDMTIVTSKNSPLVLDVWKACIMSKLLFRVERQELGFSGMLIRLMIIVFFQEVIGNCVPALSGVRVYL